MFSTSSLCIKNMAQVMSVSHLNGKNLDTNVLKNPHNSHILQFLHFMSLWHKIK